MSWEKQSHRFHVIGYFGIVRSFHPLPTLSMSPSSRLIPTGAVVGVGDSSAGVMCPWLDTLGSGLILIDQASLGVSCDLLSAWLIALIDWTQLIVIECDWGWLWGRWSLMSFWNALGASCLVINLRLPWSLNYFQFCVCKWRWWWLGFLQRQQFGFPQRQKSGFLQRQQFVCLQVEMMRTWGADRVTEYRRPPPAQSDLINELFLWLVTLFFVATSPQFPLQH